MRIAPPRVRGAALVALVAACTWVQPTPGGQAVRVATAEQVTGCTRVGTVRSQIAARVGIFSRDPQRVARELEQLGRNEAAELGADTLVPESRPADDRQTFGAYRCGR